MKNIDAIKEQVTAMDIEYTEKREKDILDSQEKLFKIYDEVEEIQKLLRDLENVVNGEYVINAHWLEYQIEITIDILSLPQIEEYLTKDFGHLGEHTYLDFGHLGENTYVCQSIGSYIGVNRSGGSHSYFVYDSDNRKEIVKRSDILEEGHPTISEEQYISAKIALYQIEQGEFNYVIEVDYYGNCIKQFDFEGIEDFENTAPLLKIIDEYENYNNEDED